MYDQISVMLKDGAKRSYIRGISLYDVVGSISKKLAKNAIAAVVNGKTVDLTVCLESDAEVKFLTLDDKESLGILRHSTAHILAQAVKRLYPTSKLAIGPAIENGFYYDFDVQNSFAPEDIKKIEDEMHKIIGENLKIKRCMFNREEAMQLFKEREEPYKVALIAELPEDEEISCYEQGEFIDLCTGPHVPSTGMLGALKLMSVAGAYWRGDDRNAMLQRIYGTAWSKPNELKDYLDQIEEAKRRDHRRLGRDLDLYSFNEVTPGSAFFHGKGMVLRNELVSFWRKKHRDYGYQEVKTPIIMNRKLWEQSGHWKHYRENMYVTEIDGEMHALKPMSCPGSMIIYKSKLRSYRNLPLRMCELGLVHRHELSGVLHGLMRVRSITQDDAHIYMGIEHIHGELSGVIDLVAEFYRIFGFDYYVELSTKPEKAMGSDEVWEKATSALRDVLQVKSVRYVVNEGDGAFYGPKIDFHIKDSLGRKWQCATVQLDFLMPERFDLKYIGVDGKSHRPIMLHRTVFGALERFIGVLVEHFAGAFPTWLAPLQGIILPVTEAHSSYARRVAKELARAGIRVEVDSRNEKLGFRIRQAQLQKVPYMLVVGDKEKEIGVVAVRSRRDGDQGAVPVATFIQDISAEIREKRL